MTFLHTFRRWENIICGPATAEIIIVQKPIIRFNDPYFLKAILQNSNVDLNGDSQISIKEAEACTVLDVNPYMAGHFDKMISDMTEIKYFTNLKELDCSNNQFSQLDVSNNTRLTDLSCGYNQLSQLDVSNNTQLMYLNCNDNQLTQLDVSNNTQLTDLRCYGNPLEKLILAAAQQYEDWFDDIMDKYPDLDIIFTE